jgi:hypothetical protein
VGLVSIVTHVLLRMRLAAAPPLNAASVEIRQRYRPAPLWSSALDWRCPLCLSLQTDRCMPRTVAEGHIQTHGPHKKCEVSRAYNIESQSYRA